MALAKNSRGQGSVEFVAIAGVMFFILMGTLLVIQDKMAEAQRSKIYEASNGLGNLISSEVRLAESVKGAYSREFFIPFEIAGYNYSITLPASSEIVISIENIDYVVFLEMNVSGNIGKGRNVITKSDENITINNLPQPTFCIFGAALDDEFCGLITCSGWYSKYGNSCYNKTNMASNRCEGIGDCKDGNTEDCNLQPDDKLQYACGECQYIAPNDCLGTNLGGCTNWTLNTPCQIIGLCDGLGHCVISGATSFIVKNNFGNRVASFNESGNITLTGTCTSGITCTPPSDSFVIRNTGGEAVAYIDNGGNMCLRGNDCIGHDVQCNGAGTNSFVVKNAVGTNVIFIDESGGLCMVGTMVTGGTP